MGRDLGDFQTPRALVAAVLARLTANGGSWRRALEPNCGRGNFLAGLLSLETAPREIQGVELQPEYLSEARDRLSKNSTTVRSTLIQANLFEIDLKTLRWDEPESPILVVGNPPWVTNSEFGALQSLTRPPRSNLKNARGIDAITGASNFDAAEAVWLKLLSELADQSPTIALLCKTAVARNVLEYARSRAISVEFAELIRINAREWFGASVEACLLVIRLGKGSAIDLATLDRVPVFADLGATVADSFLGFARGRTVADIDRYTRYNWADGTCSLTWRQGLKHDAASVMELSTRLDGSRANKAGESVDVEPEFVFPLLKGTDLSRLAPVEPRHSVIVTQRNVGEDTRRLANDAPRLFAYLHRHFETFSKRKSSVYRGRTPFAMFGIGPYTFSPYKVGVSGLHKKPVFQAIGFCGGRPVMLDDTGYFLPCDSPEQTALIATLLNGPDAIGLLDSLSLPGAKRPVTKRVLQRLDLQALYARADHDAIRDRSSLEVVRLSGREARWPSPIESLLEPAAIQEPEDPFFQKLPGRWPSPPSMTSVAQ